MTETNPDILVAHGERNRIVDVTLFTNQAYVTRLARVDLVQGPQRIQLEVMAFSFDADSVQAKVFGRGELLSVQSKTLPVIAPPQEDLQELDEQLRELKRQRLQLSNKEAVLEKQIRFLDSTLQYAEVEVPREIQTSFPTAAQLREMVDFMDERYSRLMQRGEQLKHELEQLKRKIEVTERNLKRLRHRPPAEQKIIEVLFNSSERQSVNVEATYGVYEAGWQSFYKADVAEDLSELTLTQYADIRQQSGESWEQVTLNVSTAELLRGVELPQAYSWILRKPLPYVAAGMAAGAPTDLSAGEDPFMAAMACLEEESEPSAPMPRAADVAQAQRKALPTAFEYSLPLPVDVPSADDNTLLSLSSRDTAGSFYYHAVPRLDTRCFLVCKTEPDPELPPGRLNVHFGGRFVATSQLNAGNAGDPLYFNLGADRSVRVYRETLTDKIAETFFRMVERSHTARELEYRITVENLKETPVTLSLFDTLPISETDRYQVKDVELHPEPNERDWEGRKGVMHWQFQLEAKEKREVKIRFFVKFPRNERPAGL